MRCQRYLAITRYRNTTSDHPLQTPSPFLFQILTSQDQQHLPNTNPPFSQALTFYWSTITKHLQHTLLSSHTPKSKSRCLTPQNPTKNTHCPPPDYLNPPPGAACHLPLFTRPTVTLGCMPTVAHLGFSLLSLAPAHVAQSVPYRNLGALVLPTGRAICLGRWGHAYSGRRKTWENESETRRRESHLSRKSIFLSALER